MKKNIVYISILAFFGCNESVKKNNNETITNSNIDSLPFIDTNDVSKGLGILSIVDYFMLECLDSLNNFKGNDIPKFVFNPNIDMEQIGCWPTTHTPISLRKMIIEKVTNCESLKMIADSKNANLDIKPIDIKSNNDLVNELPYNDRTTRSLIQDRIKELNCEKD